jgi:carboxyl-terminal processing protease
MAESRAKSMSKSMSKSKSKSKSRSSLPCAVDVRYHPCSSSVALQTQEARASEAATMSIRGSRYGRVRRANVARTAAVALALLSGSGCTGASTDRSASLPGPLPEAEALEVFDFAWSRVHESYYDTTFGGLDWGAIGAELRPRAAAARSVDELRAVVAEMLDRLGDSHFAVIPAEHADALDPAALDGSLGEPGTVGVDVRVVDEALVVFRVAESGAAARAGVRPGWVIERIDDRDAARLLAVLDEVPHARRLAEARVAMAAEARLAGRVGDTLAVTFRDGSGSVLEKALVSQPRTGTPVRFGNLPTLYSSLEHRQIPIEGGCVGIIRFDVWMTPILPDLESAFLEHRHCDGFVLDLRGNPGGVAGMAMAVSGYFMAERRTLGVMKTRGQDLSIVSMPRRVTADGRAISPFEGPLALVVDGQSMSTTEIFAAGLQGLDRARVFGETTGGQALPALMTRMPNGDVLMYAFADFVGPDGTRIEGRGAVPDTRVPLTRQGLLAGRDDALLAAIDWIIAAAGGLTNGTGGTR